MGEETKIIDVVLIKFCGGPSVIFRAVSQIPARLQGIQMDVINFLLNLFNGIHPNSQRISLPNPNSSVRFVHLKKPMHFRIIDTQVL